MIKTIMITVNINNSTFKRGKMKTAIVRLFLCFLLLQGNIDASFGQYITNGSAINYGNGLVRMTSKGDAWVSGSAWNATQHSLKDTFELKVDLFFGCDNGPNGADGIAFQMHTGGTAAVGAGGGGMGMVPNSIGIEFDTWNYAAGGDIADDHITIVRDGNPNSIGPGSTPYLAGPVAIAGGRDLEDCAQNSNDYYTVTYRFIPGAVSQTLEVYEENALVPALSYTGDIINGIFGGDTLVWWGFTSSTGGGDNEQWVSPHGGIIPWQCTINSCCVPFTVNTTGPLTLCQGDTADISVVGTYEKYAWSTGDSTVSSKITAPGWYTVDVIQNQLGSFCPGTDSIQVVAVGGQGVFSGDATICDDGVTTSPLTITFSGGVPPYTLNYTKDGIPQTPITGIMSSPYVFNSSAGSGIYEVTSMPDNGGCNVFVSGNVTLSVYPSLPVAVDADFCPDDTAHLAVLNEGGSYEWYSVASGGSVIHTGVSFTTPVLSASTTYYVENNAIIDTIKTVASYQDETGGTGGAARVEIYDGTFTTNTIFFTANQDLTIDSIDANVNQYGATCNDVQLQIRDLTNGTTDLIIYTPPVCLGLGTNVYTIPVKYDLIEGNDYVIGFNSSGPHVPNVYANMVPSFPITDYPEITFTSSGNGANWWAGLFRWQISYPFAGASCSRTPVLARALLTPVVTATANSSLCGGDSIQLEAFGASTYLWDNGITNLDYVSPSTEITYGVNGIAVNGCSDSAYVTISVDPKPVISGYGIDPSTCGGSDGEIVIKGLVHGDMYTVMFNGGNLSSLVANGDSIRLTGLSQGTFTNIITVTAAGCSDTIPALVLSDPAKPRIGIPNDTTICARDSVVLTVFNPDGASLLWDNGITDNSAFVPLNTTSYTIIGSLNNCDSIGTVTVSVTSLPLINAGLNDTVCLPSQVTLTASNPDGAALVWNNGITDGVAFVPSLGEGQQFIVEGVLNGCTNNDTVLVTAYTLPSINAGLNDTVCEPSQITLTATNPDGATLVWNNSIMDGMPFTPSVGNGQQYIVEGTLNGCVNGDTVLITVNPKPVINAYGIDPTNCGGTDGEIVITGLDNGASYVVMYNGGNISNQTAVGDSVRITGLTDALYSNLIVETTNGCSDTINAVVLTVPGKPDLGIPNDTMLCAGEELSLSALNPDGASISWDNGITNGVLFSPISTTVYTVTASLSGCDSIGAVTVTVNPIPNVGAGINDTLCEPSQITLTATNPDGAILVWNNSVTDGVPFAPAVGSGQQYIVEGTLNGCVNSDTVFVTVFTLPTIGAGVDDTVCELEQLTLNAINPDGAAIVWNNGVTDGVPFMPSIGINQQFIVEATLNGCVDSDTILVTVHPKPRITAYPINPSTCGGSDGEIVVKGLNNGETYAVIFNGGSSLNLAASGDSIRISGLTDALYSNIIVGTAAGCSDTVSNVVLTAPGKPNIGMPNDTTICKGESISLSLLNPDGATILWDNGVVDGVTFVPVISTIYTVTGTLNGCDSVGTVNINVNPIPTIDAGIDDTVCMPTQVTLNATNPDGATLVWNNGVFDGVPFSPLIGNDQQFVVEGTLNGCVNSDTVLVTAFSLPIINAGSNDTICEFEQVTLSAFNPNGASLIWTGGISDGVPFTPSLGMEQQYVVQGILNGCRNSDTVLVTVFPLPIISVAGIDPSACAQADGQLVVSGLVTGDTYGISFNNQASSNYIASMGRVSIGNLAAGVYSNILVESEAGCKDQVNLVTLSDPNAPNVIAPNDTSVCDGGSVQIIASNPDNATLTWTNGVADGDVVMPAITTSYTVTATRAGCSAFDGVTVTVNSLPSATLIGGDTLCDGPGNVAQGIVSVVDGVAPFTINYNSPSATGVINNNVFDGHEITLDEAGDYQLLSISDDNNCVGTAKGVVTIALIPPLNVQLITDECDPLTSSYSVELFLSGGIAPYTLSGMGELTTDILMGSYTTLSVNGTASSESQDYQYVITDASGCTEPQYKVVVAGMKDCETPIIDIPNSITPNNDGINDSFWVTNIEFYPDNEIKIYNRWGDLIYKDSGYMNDWEGKKDGELLPTGTYYYVLDLRDGSEVNTGFIMLLE